MSAPRKRIHTVTDCERSGKHLGLWDKNEGNAPRVEIVLSEKDLLL